MTNQEMFLYELDGHGYVFENKTWIVGLGGCGGVFEDDQLNMVWEMWNAAQQREGYKFVPVEPSDDAIKFIGGSKQEATIIYKAMIEAAP